MASLEIRKLSSKNGIFAILWILIWIVHVTEIFVFGRVPQTMGGSFEGTVIVCFGPFFAYYFWKRMLAADVITKRSAISKTPSVEDRLDQLERLKRRDMVTPEEYATKRREILKDL